MPGSGVLARFHRPGGRGFELSFCPGDGEFAHQKNCPGGGWSDLELTDTLNFETLDAQANLHKITGQKRSPEGTINGIQFWKHLFGLQVKVLIKRTTTTQKHPIIHTYWMRPSPTSSLLHPDKVILGEAKLSPILFCTGEINWMLDEVRSNKCFTIPKKSVRINKLFGRGLCLPK